MRLSIYGLVLLLALSLPAVVSAKLCGDNVAGRDIPCDCGDIVASSVVLANDPITRTTCSGDGLVIRAMNRQHAVTLDLHGATLRGGHDGAGILVIQGGPGGARITSTDGPATITGFRDGVMGHGRDSIRSLSHIEINSPSRDGVRINGGMKYAIHDVEVRQAGRHGFALSGSRFRLRKTRALNSKQIGYVITGKEATLGALGAGPVARGSGGIGFSLMGSGHRLIDCAAEASAKTGILLNGSRFLIHNCRAVGNGGDGIAGTGVNIRMGRNLASENENNGIVVEGHGLANLGGNRGELNRGMRIHRSAVQCQIGHVPCAQ